MTDDFLDGLYGGIIRERPGWEGKNATEHDDYDGQPKSDGLPASALFRQATWPPAAGRVHSVVENGHGKVSKVGCLK